MRLVTARPELLPGVLAVGVFIVWTATEGGFFVTSSAPGGLFLVGLVLATAIAYRVRFGDLPVAVRWLIGLFGAFVVWNFLSISWADVKGDAWDGANRVLIYFVVFTLFAITPWRPASAAVVLGLWSVGVAVVGVIAVIDAAGSAQPLANFVAYRFAEPTGYHNANAALFAVAFWPALVLASRREVPWPLRGVMLATAGVLFQLALLPQSRGWLIAFPLAAVVALALVPGRARMIAASVPIAVAALASSGPILEVFDVTTAGGDVGAALDEALDSILLTALALLVVGAASGFADGRIRLSERASGLARRAVGIATTAAALVGVVVALGATGNPVSWTADRWEDFKSGEPEEGFGSSRLGGQLGSSRYDFWRVALDGWADDPLLGRGADNFAVDYVRERQSFEEPLHPHSLPIRILSQGGLVGAALFGSFLLLAVAAVVGVRALTPSPLGRAVAGVALVTVAYWFLHSSGDWFWTLPALTAPAFAWLGLGSGIGRQGATTRAAPQSSRRTVVLGAGSAAALGVLMAASLTLPLASALDVDAAARGWGADPAAAYERLDRAADTNVLSARPALVEGAIAARLGDRERMRAAFTEALDREPESWYALLELGALDALEGNRRAARARLAEAQRLNPRDTLITAVANRARQGRPLPLAEIDRELLTRVCQRLGRAAVSEDC